MSTSYAPAGTKLRCRGCHLAVAELRSEKEIGDMLHISDVRMTRFGKRRRGQLIGCGTCSGGFGLYLRLLDGAQVNL